MHGSALIGTSWCCLETFPLCFTILDVLQKDSIGRFQNALIVHIGLIIVVALSIFKWPLVHELGVIVIISLEDPIPTKLLIQQLVRLRLGNILVDSLLAIYFAD